MKDSRSIERILYYLSTVLLLAVLAFYLSNIFSNNAIWLDESFSLEMIRHPFAEMIKLTAMDVHPPLYYILYKIFYAVLSRLGLPLTAIAAGKFFSLLCFILLAIMGMTFIKKEFGYYSASVYILLLITLPNLMYYSIEIRMYPLATLLVTLTFMAGYYVLKRGKLYDYALLAAFALLSSYTHYYACIACIFIFLFILGSLIYNKKPIWYFLGTSLAVVIGYLPWLFILVTQLRIVSDNYWIPALTGSTVADWFTFFLFPFRIKWLSVIFVSVFLVLIAMAIYNLLHSSPKKEKVFTFKGLFLPILIIIFGYLLSIQIRPLYFNRYVLPTIGVFALAYAVIINYVSRNRFLRLVPVVLLIVSAVYCNYDIIAMEDNRSAQAHAVVNDLSSLRDNDVIIFENSQIQRTVASLTAANTYLYYPGTSTLTAEVYHNVYDYTGTQMIDDELAADRKVFFVPQSSESPQLEELRYNGFSVDKVGSYQLESYFFDVYSVSR